MAAALQFPAKLSVLSVFPLSLDRTEWRKNAMKKYRLGFLISGPILFFLCYLLIPESVLDVASRAAVGTFAWMAAWWIGSPVEPAVTALLPILLNALFGMIDMDVVISQYMSETTLMVFGATIVSQAWSVTKLDKRFALKALSLIGISVRQQVLVWFILAVVLSMIFPNLLVGVMLLPIAFAMLEFSGEIHSIADVPHNKSASLILAASIWGTYIGGMGTPLGGSMNLVAVNYFEVYTGHEYMYINWFLRMLPLLAATTAVSLMILTFLAPKDKELNGTKEYFVAQYEGLPKITRSEIVSGLLFFVPVILAFIRPVFAELLPNMKTAYMFIIAAFLTFFLQKEDRTPIFTWSSMEKKFQWSLLFMLSSGLALGQILSGTNSIQVIADAINTAGVSGGLGTVLIFTVISMAIAELSNSIVSASLSIPIIIGVASNLGLNPIPFIYVNIAALNSAFMMPTSVRAIPVGYGVEPKFIMKNGFFLSLGTAIVITLLGYFLIACFPGFMSVA